MKITFDIIVTDENEVFVFPRPGSPGDAIRFAFACSERDELPHEISTAVHAAVDAHAAEAVAQLRAFLRAGVEQLAEERNRLDADARRSEWSA